jgi:hypothetical protein
VTRIEDLAEQREELAARCAAERDEIAQACDAIERRAGWLRRTARVGSWLAGRRWLVAAGLVAFATLGPRGLVRRVVGALDLGLVLLRMRSKFGR